MAHSRERNEGSAPAGTAPRRKRRKEEEQPPRQQQPIDTAAPAFNQYKGVRVGASGKLPVVDAATVLPEAFFRRFVARRCPCILQGSLPEIEGRAPGWWAPPRARQLEVQVEVRDGPADRFGRGRKRAMRFGELLDADSPNYYLTTQDVPDGQLCAPPLSALEQPRELPTRPALLGTLVPQSINLWLGRSAALASSGLHHDFHDNLYVLLRGRKHFRLFSPADAAWMYTHGELARVHANGRINYVGHESTSADGRTAADAAAEALRAAKRAQRATERELESAEEAMDEQRVAQAEDAMEDAMDAALGAKVAHRNALRRREAEEAAAAAASAAAEAEGLPPPPPPSFSQVPDLPAALVAGADQTAHPLLHRARVAEFDLHEGQMLYLPCGWFHEVWARPSRRVPSPDCARPHSCRIGHVRARAHTHTVCLYRSAREQVSSQGAHAALNYWFHPPDQPDYAAPYSAGGFWEREAKQHEGKRRC